MKTLALSGLDLLPTAVVLVDAQLTVRYLNSAAENLFEMSSKNVSGQPLERLVHNIALIERAVGYARTNNCSYTEHELELGVNGRTRFYLSCTVTPVDMPVDLALDDVVLLEFRHVERQLRIAREARILDQSQANRELIRNLAHEIKNPLGGIRGAAQLLDRELDRPDLHEYTQVIMNEADRLQSLMDRLLTPHRLPRPAPLNIHEVLDRDRDRARLRREPADVHW
jgi:two-component system nitrogen regulation sensor histidine kinase GlnL